MTDKEKIKAEIKRLKIEKRKENLPFHALYYDGYDAACNKIIAYINSLPAEQPSEDLEEEIKRKYKSDIALMMPIKDFRKLIHHFTNWQKAQMMKGLCLETKVYQDEDGDGIDTPIESWLALENNEINAEKERIKAELVPLYERRGLKSRLQRLKENIVALQTEQREKGAELAEYETQRELVKAYKQEQMEILSRKVNDGLCFSRIEVWSKQKDGNMVPDLVLKDEQGVSFACTNNASRIVTTVDVQRFFCDRLGVNMPCWVDECAVVDDENMPRFDGTQMFYMFRADTSLKIETK